MARVINIMHGFETVRYMPGLEKTVINIMHGFETICLTHKM